MPTSRGRTWEHRRRQRATRSGTGGRQRPDPCPMGDARASV
ncbi:hypothetical protein [Nocardioides malaquae]|nr:hypothetical protein [Nocardioides malaquae]